MNFLSNFDPNFSYCTHPHVMERKKNFFFNWISNITRGVGPSSWVGSQGLNCWCLSAFSGLIYEFKFELAVLTFYFLFTVLPALNPLVLPGLAVAVLLTADSRAGTDTVSADSAYCTLWRYSCRLQCNVKHFNVTLMDFYCRVHQW